MDHKNEACIICAEKLVYSTEGQSMKCEICKNTFTSNAKCVNGHFICDECHSKNDLETLLNTCKGLRSTNPQEIMLELMRLPSVHMHGPEHHSLIGLALMTACHNAGAVDDLSGASRQVLERSKKVPGGICGFWGACGSAIGAGIFLSVLTAATPLSTENYGKCNLLTSKCLERIAAVGGPRCCKRNTSLSIGATVDFLSEHFGIELERASVIECAYTSVNAECIGARCPNFKA